MAADDTLSIRDATLADAADVRAIYARSVETACASYETVAPGIDEMRRRMTALLDAGYPYLVAEFDARLPGRRRPAAARRHVTCRGDGDLRPPDGT